MERYELPDDWKWRELAQVVEIGSEQVNPSRFPNELFNYLALENIEQGSGEVIDFAPTPGKDIKSNKFKFTNKHVLYGKLRPYLRKAFAPDFEGVSATDLLPLLPDENNLDRKFLVWWLLSPQILEYVVGKQAGVKMPRLRSNDLAQMPIPIPTLLDQQRIVAKIESLFEQSRAARGALTRVPMLMAQFRRAVLASAFRGELVEPDPNDEPAVSLLERIREERRRKWEAELRAKGKDPTKYEYKEPALPDASDLPELSDGWVWVNVETLASDEAYSITDGPFGSNLKTVDYVNKGVRVIRLQNVGIIEFKDRAKSFISFDKFETLRKHEVKAGDVIIAALADPVGRACIVPENLGQAIVKADCIKLNVDSRLANNKYVLYALNNPDHFERAAEMAHGVGRLRANLSDVKSFVVPLAPLSEQQRIVDKIEAMFAQADIIEQAASVSLRRAEQVDQSILARAFRGELG